MADVLTACQLGYRRGHRRLTDDVSLSLHPGELVSLIGPNGAGKSTLLRLLSGFLTPQRGHCLLNNQPLAQWSPGQLAQLRAVMRQQSSMAFSLSVADVVAMGRAPWPQQAVKPVVEQVMALTGCDELANRDYLQLSGGEQQRVQLARALAQLWRQDGPCGWLFLDEPTSALDLYHQQHLLRLLSQLTQQYPVSVCCVLHDLNLAALWSDRVMLLADGRLVAQGKPYQVINEAMITRWYQAEVLVHPHLSERVPQVALLR
ncbi:heme ABC transporter ATP-binding protein [Erwinia pyrifoliae]|uniref:Heme ABC transporter ATP-binding protein n=1 Tax=Erwinia pyrifoliae TaxID=79967 RepID=A0ABY5XDM5_ERWPY|nr:heme ABC transporter ATP-binding protein [Erwinia pyrifoliae]AUX72602.1 heme ABC transporter ATP-binding protein [Erwinia pyrifoliae]MCA8877138.1 heme ABC transporter ATP-binding protein [Erwinia pyrifoliae]MCU8587114.1 heme ABC transporter ATP-binding protein [Erwinia pyrifoliae]UWS30977.1 heme ABC transporter ATP-binding protein [Erwinia pyrifoliae]UWS35225.1 heme ABC transporter ATP-binding protein [Erwinia pyrifoliae]